MSQMTKQSTNVFVFVGMRALGLTILNNHEGLFPKL